MAEILTLLGPFGLGLLNMSNPCILPLYPGFLAYIAGNSDLMKNRSGVRWLGVVVLAGVLTSMLIVGGFIALLQVAIGSVLAVLLPISYGLLIVLGSMMLLDINPFARLPVIGVASSVNPLVKGFAYGLLYGPMTLPCSGPLIVGAFLYSAADARSFLESIAYVLAFGLGFGLPLLILPLLTSTRQKSLLYWLSAHHQLMTRMAGVLMIAIGVISFIKQWDLIRHYWQF